MTAPVLSPIAPRFCALQRGETPVTKEIGADGKNNFTQVAQLGGAFTSATFPRNMEPGRRCGRAAGEFTRRAPTCDARLNARRASLTPHFRPTTQLIIAIFNCASA